MIVAASPGYLASSACDDRSGAGTVASCLREELQMPDWKVLCRDGLDQDRTSRSSPSEEAALERARQLYFKERAEIYRIEGPSGMTLRKEEIMRWLSANKGQTPLF